MLFCGSLDPDLLLSTLLFTWLAYQMLQIFSGTACCAVGSTHSFSWRVLESKLVLLYWPFSSIYISAQTKFFCACPLVFKIIDAEAWSVLLRHKNFKKSQDLFLPLLYFIYSGLGVSCCCVMVLLLLRYTTTCTYWSYIVIILQLTAFNTSY